MKLESFRINDTQFSHALKDLGEFVKIPSVSNPNSPDYSMEQLLKAANFAGERLQDLGFDVESHRIEGSAPFVVAQKIADIAIPTILLYAHYDVQPVDRAHWNSEPFTMEERNERLYGRGVSDDKGGVVAILTALKAFKENNASLPVNVIVLLEGEEEYGSAHMKPFLEQHAAKIHANALVIMDGMNCDTNVGTLSSSTRGLVNFKLQVKALEKPVHSGLACLSPDPAMGLSRLIASLSDPRTIPGFMDDYQALNDQERSLLRANSQSAASYAAENGVHNGASLRGDPSKSIYERIAEEPSLSILNMQAGIPGGGNSIQSVASCEVSIRATAGQDPARVSRAVQDYLLSQSEAIGGQEITTRQAESGSYAWKAELEKPYSIRYLDALKEVFGKIGSLPMGGTLPLLSQFKAVFPTMEIIIPGVLDPTSSAHSHNESQDKKLLRDSIDGLINFLHKAAQP